MTKTTTKMQLRDYQSRCLEAVRTNFGNGVRRQLCCLPTGSGKTVIFATLPNSLGFDNGEPTLVIAHREELIEQARQKLQAANPTASIGIEMAGQSAGPDDQIVIASVQSLVHRLDRHDPASYRLLICDEAHHGVAKSYRKVFEHFGFANGRSDDRLLVGFTATAKRGDGVGLAAIFDKITFHRNLREMIAAGWLVDIIGYRVETGADISGVHSRAGDFVRAELSVAVNTKARNELIVETYGNLAAGRKALVFAVDVQHAADLAEAFQSRGVKAEAVSGRMPKAERRRVVESYRSGDIDVLANCNLLTEGFDDPETNAVLMARPTKSGLLYQQMLGRGTRTAPGKQDLLLLDFCDATKRHSAVTLPDLFGLNPQLNLDGRKVAETLERVESAGVDAVRYTNIERLEARIKHINVFEVPEQSQRVRELTRLSWIPMFDGVYRLMMPGRQSLSVVENALGRHEVYSQPGRGRPLLIREFPSLAHAFAFADGLVPQNNVGAVLSSARWRKQPPSLKQLKLAQKLKLAVPGDATKGSVGAMLSNYFAQRSQSRLGDLVIPSGSDNLHTPRWR